HERVGRVQAGPAEDVRAPAFGATPADRPGPLPAAGPPALPEGWGADDTDLDLAITFGGEERAEQRERAHIVVRAVDRVHVPPRRAGAHRGPVLLPDDVVVGKTLHET